MEKKSLQNELIKPVKDCLFLKQWIPMVTESPSLSCNIFLSLLQVLNTIDIYFKILSNVSYKKSIISKKNKKNYC